jgi:hypothetical protein
LLDRHPTRSESGSAEGGDGEVSTAELLEQDLMREAKSAAAASGAAAVATITEEPEPEPEPEAKRCLRLRAHDSNHRRSVQPTAPSRTTSEAASSQPPEEAESNEHMEERFLGFARVFCGTLGGAGRCPCAA